MALNAPIQFPVFVPTKPPNRFHHRLAAVVRFSRWNNANAEKFNRERHSQKEIEDQLRLQKRFDSTLNIAYNYNPAPPTPTFKSIGTPSFPSRPSIQGKKSKYSTNSQLSSHPAFKPIVKKRKIPIEKINPEENEDAAQEKPVANVRIDDKGLCYEFPDAPFLYQYSYTETPKVKPVAVRESLVPPFEPATMRRPWTGRKPLPPSKKKLPEFDSFRLPPSHKKGVKPVQAPGPYLAGSGPKYARSREKVLGEPLTPEEVKMLIDSTRKSTRQLNMGRDGLTHNMLENIHAHWKRRRVCKIKCLGVCTVDMDNVRQQLEEKTGGKIIFSRGGVVYLFRGRNYNYMYRPRFPLMLWKPVSPVYPRLIKRIPEGLTLEEATDMRKKGRNLTSICKLGKNGVYCDLVKDVREAFEACELVRINCQGLNGSDYRKIGAKLKELVPCVLISFEHEHILMWRGRDWKSSLPGSKNDADPVGEHKTDTAIIGPKSEGQARSLAEHVSTVPDMLVSNASENQMTSTSSLYTEDVESEESREYGKEGFGHFMPSVYSESLAAAGDIGDGEKPPSNVDPILVTEFFEDINGSEKELDGHEGGKEWNRLHTHCNELRTMQPGYEVKSGSCDGNEHSEHRSILLQDMSENKPPISVSPSMEGVLVLWRQAVGSGSAFVLEHSSLDADTVFERTLALAQSAPPGPIFRKRSKKLANEGSDQQPSDDVEVKKAAGCSALEARIPGRKGSKKSGKNQSMRDVKVDYLNVAPRGSLGVDELAKLLS